MSNPWDDVTVPGVICPNCGEVGTYWDVRDYLPPHVSYSGYEIAAAGIDHADGTTCEEW